MILKSILTRVSLAASLEQRNFRVTQASEQDRSDEITELSRYPNNTNTREGLGRDPFVGDYLLHKSSRKALRQKFSPTNTHETTYTDAEQTKRNWALASRRLRRISSFAVCKF